VLEIFALLPISQYLARRANRLMFILQSGRLFTLNQADKLVIGGILQGANGQFVVSDTIKYWSSHCA